MSERPNSSGPGLVLAALGYFACYAPYSALTRATSLGLLPGLPGPVTGLVLLPITTVASLLAMLAFLLGTGWWRHATRHDGVPGPTALTTASGLATALIIGTTTLAYTFPGTSIVMMMLLMRGGVLVIAPIADRVSRRPVRPAAWVALVLSLLALVVALAGDKTGGLSLGAAVDVALYLGAYFFRLRWMSHQAKSEVSGDNLRYFVEEQMVATPATVLGLLLGAWLAPGQTGEALRLGFSEVFRDPRLMPVGLLIGVLSQGTGVFGALILLDKRENSFCVPVNRAASILAGLLATFGLSALFGLAPLPPGELAGAGLVVLAIVILSASSIHRKE